MGTKRKESKVRLASDWYSLYTDGASKGNPGQAGAGIVIISPNGSIFKKCFYLGKKTNNEAEYHALILGLKEACKQGIKNLHIYLDSQLVVRQIQGDYKIKASHLRALYQEVKKLLNKFTYQIYHIKRENNKLADKLANYAIANKNGS